MIVGIAAITLLEAIALLKGFDGILLTSVIGTIAGLIMWQVKPPKLK